MSKQLDDDNLEESVYIKLKQIRGKKPNMTRVNLQQCKERMKMLKGDDSDPELRRVAVGE